MVVLLADITPYLPLGLFLLIALLLALSTVVMVYLVVSIRATAAQGKLLRLELAEKQRKLSPPRAQEK